MQEINERIAQLILKHLQGILTEEEQEELQAWIYESKENELAFEKASDVEILKKELKVELNREEKMWAQLQNEFAQEPEVVPFRSRHKWYRIAAASILIAVGIGAYFLLFNKGTDSKVAVVTSKEAVQDIAAPDVNKATITLAKGKKIYLDNAANGVLESDGNVKLVKLADGQIAYSGVSKEIIYNTLSNPRGSKVIDITLSDGSRVWLNNESSITYPISFAGSERKVVLKGEGYFEVARNARKKFIVDANGTSTEVLGTHFNVNAYSEENRVTTTLFEGSVRVKSGAEEALLKPGQQTQVSGNNIKLVNDASLEAAIAWKNGFIVFSSDMKTILRQIGRWYDVDIEYKGEINVPDLYSTIPRNITLSELLKAIEINTKLKFKIEGKKVTVQP